MGIRPKEKEEKIEEKQKEREERKPIKRKIGGEKKRKIFSVFRRSNLDNPRVKVDPRNEGYAWVQKSWSFVKLYEVENFPTLIISSLKAI